MRRWLPNSTKVRALLLGGILLVATISVGASSVMAQETIDEPAVVADVQETGTVDLTVVYTYDLETATEREAFQGLSEDESLEAAMQTRFAERMTAVADASATRVDRTITVTAVDLAFDSTDSTGIVRLTATMDDLAAVSDDQITLTQPFSEGFQTDRPVIVSAPDGYEITAASPEPDIRNDETLTWNGDRSLGGFEVTASDTSDMADTTATSTPGMGLLIALVALLGAVAYRRRHP